MPLSDFLCLEASHSVFEAEKTAFQDHFGKLSRTRKSTLHLHEYMFGLLSPVERKNSWQLSEQSGHKDP